MTVSLALPALLATLALPQAPSGSVHGTVTGDLGGAAPVPLAHALVELRDGGRSRAVVADSAGRYVFRDVPAGPHRVRAIHVGYETLEVEVRVPRGGSVSVDLDLAPRPVPGPPLVARVERLRIPPDTAGPPSMASPGLMEAELRSLEFGSGMVEGGLAGVARSALGGGGPDEDPRAVLFMRGSTTDQKMVLLDGAPLVAPFHVGGLIRTFDPAVLGGASLYVGGAPARYDGGLAYILELETRSPRRDRVRSSGRVDLLSAEATVEGSPGGGIGAMAGLRSLHGAGTGLLGGGSFPYGYDDAVGRLDWSGGEHALALTGFWNRETVNLGSDGGETGVALPGPVRWGNAATSLRYEGRIADTDLDLTGAYSRYRARLPLRGTTPLFADASTERLRFLADLSTPALGGTLRWGGSVVQTAVESGVRRLSGEPAVVAEEGTGTVVGAHLDGSWPLGHAVRLRTGLRVDRFSTEKGLRLAPRLAVAWILSDEAVLTVAAGRYHQYVQGSEGSALATLADSTAPSAPPRILLLPVASASHLTLALDQQLTSAVRLGLEGWVKSFQGLPDGGGDGFNASGLDLRVTTRGDDLTGWLGYSLSWVWSASRAEPSSREFAGRHLLSAGVFGRLGSRVEVDLRGAYGAGLPFGAIPVGAEADAQAFAEELTNVGAVEGSAEVVGGLPESFLRLDARVSGVWETGIGGHTVELRPYVKVMNALPRRDALFYYFEPWRDETVRPVAELDLLPLVGLEWVF